MKRRALHRTSVGTNAVGFAGIAGRTAGIGGPAFEKRFEGGFEEGIEEGIEDGFESGICDREAGAEIVTEGDLQVPGEPQ